MAFARENTSYYFYDSIIKGDVTASDNSRIYLFRTTIGGESMEVGKGRIIIEN